MPQVIVVGSTSSLTCNIGALCCSHSVIPENLVGSPDVFISGKQVVRLGDTGVCNCPHGGQFKTISGNSNILVNGKPIVVIGDSIQCLSCGNVGTQISSQSTVIVG